MIRLGVNIEHVATLRQVRPGGSPDPVEAALIAERSGADVIACHLRRDRGSIQEADVERLRKRVVHLNLHIGLSPRLVEVALRIKPQQVLLVPEKRAESAPGGGLDVRRRIGPVKKVIEKLGMAGIEATVSIDPDLRQIAASRRAGASIVELHTGPYAAAPAPARKWELQKLIAAARAARRGGFEVAAGHGIDYENVSAIAAVREIEELNVGFAVVSNALFLGLAAAVRRMKELVLEARP